MSKLDPSQYLRVLRVRKAYRFDIGGLLMRLFAYMCTLGTISMLTLAGWSYFRAGTVVSVLAVSIFFVSPRISRLVDEYGQGKVVPIAVTTQMVGLAMLLALVHFNGPWQLCYVAVVLVGCTPNPMALVRARWSFLLETGRLGEDAPEIRSVFTYEGILDDAGYMLGPSISIALSALLFPVAGMLFGGICFVVGAIILMSSKDTEPEVGWKAKTTADEGPQPEAADGDKRSMFRISSMVRVLFMMMLFQGLIYGVYNAALVAFGQEHDATQTISLILASTSVGSITAGIFFGMAKFKASFAKQLVCCAIGFGVLYMLLVFADNMASVAVICFVASFSYAPLLISMNTACEKSVPGARLTESLSWMNAGATLGTTVAPTLGGIFVDQWGSLAGLDFCAACSGVFILFALACIPVVKKNLK